MNQYCLKIKSHWMAQTMMMKGKQWHFIVGEKPKEKTCITIGEDETWKT